MRKMVVAGAIVSFLCIVAAGCPPPPPPPPTTTTTIPSQWGHLVFDEEFDGTLANWNVQNNSTYGSGNNEQECYMAANSTISAGALNLLAKSGGAGCSGYTVSSGMVTTRAMGGSQKFSFTYGYAEARIKVAPFGPAAWPAFWLVGAQGTPSWPGYGEVDIVEMYGPHSPYAETNYHDNSGAHANAVVNMGDLTAYHTYGVNWTSSGFTWYYDGKQVAHYNTANNYAHTIHLNYAIGGDGPGYYGYNGNPTSSLPSTMSVDYVRVYQP